MSTRLDEIGFSRVHSSRAEHGLFNIYATIRGAGKVLLFSLARNAEPKKSDAILIA